MKVLGCEKVPKADKLLKFTLFDGERERTVVSGIAQYYKPEELVGKKLACVVNLAPHAFRGIVSEGMLLSSEAPDGGVHVVVIDDSVLNIDNYSLLERLERYIYLGDDRQIEHRFCRGKLIPEPKVC